MGDKVGIMLQTDNIAILMATYNGEKYIKEQIESVLFQSRSDWELYIHDDGSVDGTMQIIDSYCMRYPDKIHKISGASTGGARNNFFYLLGCVDAPYYMFCDQDDVWLKNKIKKTYSAMNKQDDGKPVLVFTDLKVVDEKLNVIADSMCKYQKLNCRDTSVKRVLIQNMCTGCTMMINRALRDEMIKAKISDNIIMHDWWAALIAAEFGKMYFISEPQILYRQHRNNSVGASGFDIKYVFNKFFRNNEIKRSLRNKEKQALYFSELYGLKDDDIAFKYGRVRQLSKIRRIHFYIVNDMYMNGLSRNIGLFLYC